MAHVPVTERRTELLAAAWRVMIRDGLAAATTRRICQEAAVSQGVFHYCFDSRDAMLEELAVDLLPTQIASADAAVCEGDTLAAAIERALGAYWSLVEADVGIHQALYEITIATTRQGTGDIARRQYQRYLAGARSVLQRIAEVCDIQWRRPLDVLARQVVTIVDGLTLHYVVDHDSTSAQAALRAFAEDLAAIGGSAP